MAWYDNVVPFLSGLVVGAFVVLELVDAGIIYRVDDEDEEE